MLEGLGITGVLIPYAVFAAAIAAVVLGLREGIPSLKKSKPISTIVPLLLGAIGGYCFPELHPKGTTHLMGTLYGVLAGSFSAPIYHAIRRLVATKLKGGSKNPKAGEELTFSGDVSSPMLAAVKKPEPPPLPPPMTKDENE